MKRTGFKPRISWFQRSAASRILMEYEVALYKKQREHIYCIWYEYCFRMHFKKIGNISYRDIFIIVDYNFKFYIEILALMLNY